MNWSRSHYLLAGLGLIGLVNAIALAGVYWNRQEPADSRLQLSKRELDTSYFSWRKENSSVALRLAYRWPSRGEDNGYYPPISAEKMAELGFSVPSEVNEDSVRRYRHQLDRDALLVLELDGPAYQRELELVRAEYAEAQRLHSLAPDNQNAKDAAEHAHDALLREQQIASRLLVVDVGLDRQALRTRYPDRLRYAIVRGSVRVYANRQLSEWPGEGEDSRSEGQRWVWQLGGSADTPGVQSINLPQRGQQTGLDYASTDKLFSAEITFGRRLEPWVTQLQARQP
ncbi:DUF4824 family protein [Pseudomonas sp. LS44]|uniref:DUF4824 family protein n=1 Tax=Pseudomonas sp. LS44 TaxID=1357074 RepID=UPI00215B175F|nr:DUF4824 family protein [Pseudomonas sp. LS44]UVE19137.1 DUF4824 family protein [Pseudomonas sp. LS44]